MPSNREHRAAECYCRAGKSEFAREHKTASAEHCTTRVVKGHRRRHCEPDRADGARARKARRSISGSRRFARRPSRTASRRRPTHASCAGLRPDTTGLEAIHNQPEFNQKLWQYLNRAVSDWKIAAGKEKAKQYAPLFSRIEKDFGVEPAFMLGVWGIESAFGDPVVEKNHMRPVIPSLATLAWAEPRRRGYWEQELINALMIVQRGWSTPEEMIGSWAGAMGHTQWMPEVWLHVGIDYNGDGKISPYGPPDDALGSTARFFVERGKYRRGEHWGYEVRMPGVGPAMRRAVTPRGKRSA